MGDFTTQTRQTNTQLCALRDETRISHFTKFINVQKFFSTKATLFRFFFLFHNTRTHMASNKRNRKGEAPAAGEEEEEKFDYDQDEEELEISDSDEDSDDNEPVTLEEDADDPDNFTEVYYLLDIFQ